MNLDLALRWSEILMGCAFLQQGGEHLAAPAKERWLYIPRRVLALLLIAGVQPPIIEALLLLLGMAILYRFQGPYNGGSDRMSLLLLLLSRARIWPAVSGAAPAKSDAAWLTSENSASNTKNNFFIINNS